MTQHIGIDVSKALLDVYLLPEETARQFPRDEAGLIALSGWLGSLELGAVVMEASGGGMSRAWWRCWRRPACRG